MFLRLLFSNACCLLSVKFVPTRSYGNKSGTSYLCGFFWFSTEASPPSPDFRASRYSATGRGKKKKKKIAAPRFDHGRFRWPDNTEIVFNYRGHFLFSADGDAAPHLVPPGDRLQHTFRQKSLIRHVGIEQLRAATHEATHEQTNKQPMKEKKKNISSSGNGDYYCNTDNKNNVHKKKKILSMKVSHFGSRRTPLTDILPHLCLPEDQTSSTVLKTE